MIVCSCLDIVCGTGDCPSPPDIGGGPRLRLGVQPRKTGREFHRVERGKGLILLRRGFRLRQGCGGQVGGLEFKAGTRRRGLGRCSLTIESDVADDRTNLEFQDSSWNQIGKAEKA